MAVFFYSTLIFSLALSSNNANNFSIFEPKYNKINTLVLDVISKTFNARNNLELQTNNNMPDDKKRIMLARPLPNTKVADKSSKLNLSELNSLKIDDILRKLVDSSDTSKNWMTSFRAVQSDLNVAKRYSDDLTHGLNKPNTQSNEKNVLVDAFSDSISVGILSDTTRKILNKPEVMNAVTELFIDTINNPKLVQLAESTFFNIINDPTAWNVLTEITRELGDNPIIVKKISETLNAIMKSPSIREQLTKTFTTFMENKDSNEKLKIAFIDMIGNPDVVKLVINAVFDIVTDTKVMSQLTNTLFNSLNKPSALRMLANIGWTILMDPAFADTVVDLFVRFIDNTSAMSVIIDTFLDILQNRNELQAILTALGKLNGRHDIVEIIINVIYTAVSDPKLLAPFKDIFLDIMSDKTKRKMFLEDSQLQFNKSLPHATSVKNYLSREIRSLSPGNTINSDSYPNEVNVYEKLGNPNGKNTQKYHKLMKDFKEIFKKDISFSNDTVKRLSKKSKDVANRFSVEQSGLELLLQKHGRRILGNGINNALRAWSQIQSGLLEGTDKVINEGQKSLTQLFAFLIPYIDDTSNNHKA